MTRTNSQMSNRPFLGHNGKREWLSKSLFEMNRRIAGNDSWAEPQMEARAGVLADTAVRLWPGPKACSGNEGAWLEAAGGTNNGLLDAAIMETTPVASWARERYLLDLWL